MPASQRTERGYRRGDPVKFIAGDQGRGRIEGRYVVDPVTGCWNWSGQLVRGYARMDVAGRNVGVYRVSYERKYGPIPQGLEPHHMCENPRCVNPDHIEPLTHAENIRRSTAKLSWEKVGEIRASNESLAVLGERFGVSGVTISLVRQGKMWREETRG